jgi:lysyl endopeptidase
MWIVQRWDIGLVEPGSSGGPLFNANNRIIGQLSFGDRNIGCNPTTGESFIDNNGYGRFNLSWTGGGTNTTRLSNWLGGTTPPLTMNTIRASWINTSGSNYICTNNRTLTLNDQLPGSTVTWSVSNPSLFATTGGAATSGTGTSATLRAFSSGVSGNAILTFTMTGVACNPVTVTQQLWVGIPGMPTTSPSGTVPITIGVTNTHTVFLSTAPGATSFTADWTATGAVSRIGSGSATFATNIGNFAGTGNWQVTISNACGTNSNFGQYNVTANCNPCPRIIVNNPVRDILYTEIPTYLTSLSGQKDYRNSNGVFFLMNQAGKIIKREKIAGLKQSFNLSDIQSGMYIIRIVIEDLDFKEKIIVIK